MSDQLSLFDAYDWKIETQKMLDRLVDEYELPKGSLSLLENTGRLNDNITSFSVNIYEPEWPTLPNAKRDETRNSIVLRIEEKHVKKTDTHELELIIGKTQHDSIPEPSSVIRVTKRKSEPDTIRLRFNTDSLEMIDYIKENTIHRLRNYSSKEASFGCCSRFEQCSDARKCVHENKLFSMACIYRHHLDNGRIFYGKNKNVDDHGNLIE